MKMMKNKKSKRVLAGVLITALVALGAVSVNAFADQSEEGSENDGITTTAKTVTNDETVYVLTDADGREHQRIVSAAGTLHYDGYEDSQMPVTMDISYTLDGKEIAPADLAGQSGHVEMTLRYTNHQKSDGVYVPFLVVSGILLDNEIFSNVEVTGGKVIDDGNRNIVVGYALPGMAESLDTDQVDLPEEVTISADVENFEMETIYSFATSEVFTDLELDEAGDLDLSNLGSKMDQLEDGIDQLTSGSSKLYDGTLQLSDGAKKLTDGTDALKTGSSDLYDGTKSLQSGMKKLVSGSASLQSGADALNTGGQNLSTGAATLEAGLNQLSANSSAINAGAKQMVDAVFATASQGLQAAGMNVTLTTENYSKILEQAIAAGNSQAQQIKAQLDQTMAFYNGVVSYTAGVDSASSGVASLSAGAKELASGAEQLSAGAASLQSGQKQLAAGLDQVTAGAEKLYQGTSQLRTKEKDLVDGIDQLADGSKALKEGVEEIAEEAVGQLKNLDLSQLNSILGNMDNLQAAAKGYTAFGDEGSYDSIRFIFKTDGISLD